MSKPFPTVMEEVEDANCIMPIDKTFSLLYNEAWSKKNCVFVHVWSPQGRNSVLDIKKKKKAGWVLGFCLLLCIQLISAKKVKTVFIPDNIKVEENVAKEAFVCNLSDQEIYYTGFIYAADDSLYFYNRKPVEIIKLSPKGEVIRKLHKYGRGPGEFMRIRDLQIYRGNYAILGQSSLKMNFYTKNLEFIDEFKLKNQYQGFLVNKNNEFVFRGNSASDRYFFVHDSTGKFLRKFGKKLLPIAKNKIGPTFDAVRHTLYIAEKDGVWAAFANRYDLRYYEKEKLKVKIKGTKGYFVAIEEETMGHKWMRYHDRALLLARDKNQLYYFHWKNYRCLCDIFDIDSYRLLRRVIFKERYWFLTHYKDNIFYSTIPDDDDEEVLLFKMEL